MKSVMKSYSALAASSSAISAVFWASSPHELVVALRGGGGFPRQLQPHPGRQHALQRIAHRFFDPLRLRSALILETEQTLLGPLLCRGARPAAE
jgi:hypothetical protein